MDDQKNMIIAAALALGLAAGGAQALTLGGVSFDDDAFADAAGDLLDLLRELLLVEEARVICVQLAERRERGVGHALGHERVGGQHFFAFMPDPQSQGSLGFTFFTLAAVAPARPEVARGGAPTSHGSGSSARRAARSRLFGLGRQALCAL